MGCGSSSAGGGYTTQNENGGKKYKKGVPTLRIIALNDIYVLDNFAKIKTLVEKHKKECPNVVVTMAGDFLGPSILSGLDFGRSMISVMNQIPVDYICFGNHECDVPHDSGMQRVKEFKGKWLNANMRDYAVPLPEYDILEVKDPTTQEKVKLAFTGLVLGGNIYKDGAFGGAAKSIVPIHEACPKIVAKIMAAHPDCKGIIPITHQDLADDIKTAESNMFPVVLAGHDHDVNLGVHGTNKVPVIKGGMDGINVVVVDLSCVGGKFEVDYQLVPTAKIAEHKGLQKYVYQALAPIRELEAANLFDFKTPMSTKRMRFGQNEMASWICDGINAVMPEADSILINSGAVRGDTDYGPETSKKNFSYADLIRELPFGATSLYFAVSIPGAVLRDVIKDSRKEWPDVEAGMSLQCSSDMKFTADNTLTHINGGELDPAKSYKIGVFHFVFVKCFAAFIEDNPGIVPSEEVGIGAHALLVTWFAHNVWTQLVDTDGDGNYSEKEIQAFVKSVDKDKSGYVSKAELSAAVTAKLGHPNEMIVAQLFNLFDDDGNGTISLTEVLNATIADTMKQISDAY